MLSLSRQIGWNSLLPVVVLVAVALVVVAVWHEMARPEPLGAAAVRSLMSDRTARGAWAAARPYAMYFGADGRAVYGEPGFPPIPGAWRVEEDGFLCARFGETGESCHQVGRESGHPVWIISGSRRTLPFALTPGVDPALALSTTSGGS